MEHTATFHQANTARRAGPNGTEATETSLIFTFSPRSPEGVIIQFPGPDPGLKVGQPYKIAVTPVDTSPVPAAPPNGGGIPQ